MSQSPLISVIVPAYNVRPYLCKCVKSIVVQSYENLEIILVDDGSTDGSSELCDELGSTDPRVAVYHKENGGLSDARNFGLHQAHGKWVSFIDADDYVAEVFVEALLKAALTTGCQIAALPRIKRFRDGDPCVLTASMSDISKVRILSAFDTQRLMLYQAMETGATCLLYQRGVLQEEPLPHGIYYEDLASVYRIVHDIDRLAVVDCEKLYAYRQRSTSILHQEYRHLKAKSALTVAKQLYYDICDWYPELANAAASRCFSLCRMVFAQALTGDRAAEQDRQALWAVLVKFRGTVLTDPNARRRERLAAAIACIGEVPFSFFCNLCRRTGKMN